MKPSSAPTKCSTSMIWRLADHRAARREHHGQHRRRRTPARARRGRPPRRCAPWRAAGRPSRDDRRASRRAPARELLAQRGEVGRLGARRRAPRSAAAPAARRASSPLPSQGSSSRADSSRRVGPHAGDAGRSPAPAPRLRAHRPRCRGRSDGRTWIVISRATADCQSPAAERTSTTAPSVSAARKVMMAITASSARPAIESRRHDRGFARAAARPRRWRSAGGCALRHIRPALPSRLSRVDLQPALMQHQARRVIEVHQGDVVGGDHHAVPDWFSSTNRRSSRRASWDRHCRSARRRAGSRGCAITARAIAARCFSPPERTGGSAAMRSPSPTQFNSSITSLR